MTSPVPPRARWRGLRRGAWYVLAGLLVLAALVVGTASQLLPMVERRPAEVARWLSDRAGQPVRFDALHTSWSRRGPLLEMKGLRIGEGEGVSIGEAEVLVSMYAGLLPGHSFTELRLRGLSLTLERAADGRWSVRGLPQSRTDADPLDALRRLGELQVIGGQLNVLAPSLQLDTHIPRIDVRLRVEGDRLRVGTRGWIRDDVAPVTGVLQFNRRSGDGQAWMQADPADLAAWSPLLRAAGIRVEGGEGELQGWMDLRGHRVVSVAVQGRVEQLRLSGVPFEDGRERPTADFDALQVRARWQQVDGADWRVDAPLLRIGQGDAQRRLDGLLLAGGRHFALAGEHIELDALLQVAALSGQMDAGLRRWLHAARPQVHFARVKVAGEQGGRMSAEGELLQAAFAPVGNAPGLSGLRGRLQGDAEGVQLDLEPAQVMRLDWPRGFGAPHDVHLAGRIMGWRDEAGGWRVETSAMRVQGTDYAADLRGGFWFQPNGRRPWINLAAKLDDAPMSAGKRFWIHSMMSRGATDWLDMALAGGHVRGGQGLVVGDLDDWPFDGNDGRFEASARIDRGQIRFQEDWPLMDEVDADIRFLANGFRIEGRGVLAGVPVQRFDAGIADFHDSLLTVNAASQGDAAKLVQLLRQSPLHAAYGSTLDNLVARGAATVDFGLRQPLRHGRGRKELRGSVQLSDARLQDKRWDLQFEGVNGRAEFTDGGFSAERLAVRHEGHPGELSLRAGEHVKDPLQVFEAELAAPLDAGRLLNRAYEVAWLKPYMHGTSLWNVGVSIPRMPAGSRAEPPTALSLRSDLVGTVLELPAPLDKVSAVPLATTVKATLPMDSGRIDVAFGQRLALAAASRNGRTGVQITMGSSRVDRPPPGHGLDINGRSSSLDALEWISLVRGRDDVTEATAAAGAANAVTQVGTTTAAAGAAPTLAADAAPAEDPLPLNQVDLQVGRLLLLGGVFEQTRLRLRPGAQTVSVQLDGPALAGQLSVPNGDGGTIIGTLERLHWKQAPGATDAAAASAGSAGTAQATTPAGAPTITDVPAEDPINPASIPRLALDIDDLHLGAMKLGQATVRTRPIADGLRVDQLQFRAPGQAIDVKGEWTGQGARARTHVIADVRSDELGELMQNLGKGGQLRGGQGQLQADVSWPGSPRGFQLAGVEGQLQLQARNGQLLEVEPGAGRVLGLLSVAQLPRRLMFDFRDFFSKGFAFNQVDGKVQFGDGLARTERIQIEGPAADIAIRGSADLRTQQFDQTIDVNPKAGNLLTVVGAFAGGPVGAAVGAAANAVLSKPLGEIGSRTYRVTGPFTDPKVDVIDRNAGAAPAPTARPTAD